MNLKGKFIFIGIFSLLSFIALQIPFTKLLGSNVSFTVFDFYAPIIGAFLGSWIGVAVVFLVEGLNLILKGSSAINEGSIIRLFPMLFATLYFALLSKKGSDPKWILAVPIFCILAFVANPIGREVWYYSLFWTIPIFAYFYRRNLFIRSLGTTFAAHAVGGALWIWFIGLPAAIWQSLIPIVIQERLLFAVGISVSYLVTEKVLSILIAKKYLPKLPLIAS